MQEDNVIVPFLDPHGDIGQPVELFRQRRHFMEMRGKKCSAAVFPMQIFHGRPCNGKPVKGCRSTTNLIENDQ
ncbi:hypothetical protein D3C79_919250 [compost metagenome]